MMGPLQKKDWIRRITAAAAVIILTILCEFAFNFRSHRENYDLIGITDGRGYDLDENCVIAYTPETPVYVDQLRIFGHADRSGEYLLRYTYVNGFGMEEDAAEVRDATNPWFENFYTDIKKKVSYIEIEIPFGTFSGIKGVYLLNTPGWNKYRMLFLAAIFLLGYIAVFEKLFFRKIEWFFAVYAAVFGLLMIICAQPKRASWDEEIHFRNAYRLASGREIIWSEAAYDLANYIEVSCNTKAEFAELRAYMDEKGEEYALTEYKEELLPTYGHIAYIPMALFLRLGMLLHLSFSKLYAFGKLGNLIVYILVMMLAIKYAKRKQLFLAFFAMLPTVLFLGSSYTYDAIVLSFITLGTVLWVNETTSGRKNLDPLKFIICVLLFTIGSLSKAVYVPIILLLVTMPGILRQDRKGRSAVFIAGIFMILFAVMFTFIMPVLLNAASGNLAFGGDARGGDTGTIRQMISMLKHPLASLKLIFEYNNFRFYRTTVYETRSIGNFMFMNFQMMGSMEDRHEWILLLPLFAILCHKESSSERKLKLFPEKLLIVLVAVGIIGLVWLALYLSFTPVGYEHVIGVQPRYYFPIIYLGALLVENRQVGFEISKEKLARIMLPLCVLIEGMTFYYVVIQGRLI